jgi:hypothetical protein
MPHLPDIADIDWLISEAATPWIAEAAGQEQTVALAKRLRSELGAKRSALVLEQVVLRARARTKFPDAERMYFTAKALEQATSHAVAVYKASRFVDDAAVLDACCGIGGDLISLAGRGDATGLESDAIVARLAEANCRVLGLKSARVDVAEARDSRVSEFAAWHIDPDRRSAGRRTTRLERYEPDLAALDRLLAINRNAAIKLAPASEAPAHWRAEAELEWIGERGECRQQVAWHGRFARYPGRRCATIVAMDGAAARIVVGVSEVDFSASRRIADGIGRYLFEPHAAVLAADLVDAVAAERGLGRIAPRAVYLTGDSLVADAALAAFEVQDVLPFDVKRLKRHLRERGIGRLEVKKRGVDVDPEIVRRRLQGKGDSAATLILARLRKQVRAILARRLGLRPD